MPEHAYVYRWQRTQGGYWDDEYPWAVSLDPEHEPIAVFSEHVYALGFALALPNICPELAPLAVHEQADPESQESGMP